MSKPKRWGFPDIAYIKYFNELVSQFKNEKYKLLLIDNIIINSGLNEGEVRILLDMFGESPTPIMSVKEVAELYFTTKQNIHKIVEKALLRIRIYELENKRT